MKKLLLLILGSITAAAHSADVHVGHCVVRGATVLSDAEIKNVISPFITAPMNEFDCFAATSALESSLREAGAFTAKVYPELPLNHRSVFYV